MFLTLFRLKLLDEGEDVAMILAQELSEMLDPFRMDILLNNNPSAIGEVFIDLVVQLFAVRDDNKCPVTRHLSQHLLGKENHRDTLS